MPLYQVFVESASSGCYWWSWWWCNLPNSRHRIVSDIPKLLALVSLVIHISSQLDIKSFRRKSPSHVAWLKYDRYWEIPPVASSYLSTSKVGGEASTDEADKSLERWTQQIEVGTNGRRIQRKLVQHKLIMYIIINNLKEYFCWNAAF